MRNLQESIFLTNASLGRYSRKLIEAVREDVSATRILVQKTRIRIQETRTLLSQVDDLLAQNRAGSPPDEKLA